MNMFVLCVTFFIKGSS